MNYNNFEGTVGGIGSKLMYDFFFTGKHLQLNVAADTVKFKNEQNRHVM